MLCRATRYAGLPTPVNYEYLCRYGNTLRGAKIQTVFSELESLPGVNDLRCRSFHTRDAHLDKIRDSFRQTDYPTSASEVTTLWRYRNLFIIIIIISQTIYCKRC